MKREKLEKQGHIGRRLKLIVPAMLAVLVLLVILATAVGAVSVPFFDTIKIILKNMGLIQDSSLDSGQQAIIFYVRFPRVLVAALVGAALAVSGAAMQGMFKNPMADPGVLGISSGAGLGAVIAITLGLTASSIWLMPVFAFVGAIAVAVLVFMLASSGGKVPVLTMILSGIAVSTFIGAISSVLLTFLYDYQLREFIFWTMGSLNGRRWEHVQLAVIPVVLLSAIIIFFSRDLNIHLLGEEQAQAVGLNPSKSRRLLLILVSALTATAVCVSGTISFVGLIVPHILRLLVGPDHRILLPVSAIGGAIFLVICDLIARLILIPAEINVGIITSLLGAPYFLFLLIKAKRQGGTV